MDCVICWEPLLKNDAPQTTAVAHCSSSEPAAKRAKTEGPAPLRCTPCGHVFHLQCIEQWLNTGKTCPNCRKPITKDTLKPIFLPQPETPPPPRSNALVVNLDTPISDETKTKIAAVVKGIMEVQKSEMDLEKVKTEKALDEKAKLTEELAELRRQLEAEKEKVQETERKRTELQAEQDQLVTEYDSMAQRYLDERAKVAEMQKKIETLEAELTKVKAQKKFSFGSLFGGD